MLVFEESGKLEYPGTGEKPIIAKEGTSNKLNPHMLLMPGYEPGPHWLEASTLTTVLSPAPQGLSIPDVFIY